MKKVKNREQLINRREELQLKKTELEKLIRSDWTGFKRNFGSPLPEVSNIDGDEMNDKRADRKSLRNEIVSGIAALIFRKLADRIQARMYKTNKK